MYHQFKSVHPRVVEQDHTNTNSGQLTSRRLEKAESPPYPQLANAQPRHLRIATGFILIRKTPLAVQFLERWLAACEDRRIMSEEASVLGYPEHPGGTVVGAEGNRWNRLEQGSSHEVKETMILRHCGCGFKISRKDLGLQDAAREL